jgi:hypothetical protein
MVIGGGWQCVGSDSRCIARAVAAARSAPPIGQVNLGISLGDAAPRILHVKVDAQMLRTTESGPLMVMLAICENGLVSKIGGGENGGRELTYDYTLRKLLPAFELTAAQAASVTKELNIDLDPSWSVDHLGVVAFIQDTESFRIESAAVEYPVARVPGKIDACWRTRSKLTSSS